MPKSKHGKKHKKKVAEYKKQIQITNKRLKEERMREIFQKMQAAQKLNPQMNSEVVDSDDLDIDVDLDMDLNNDINIDDIIEEDIKIDK
jgi:hypothetical protein